MVFSFPFHAGPTELELEYNHGIDNLFAKFDAITFKEEDFISLFARSIQENNEHIELDAYLDTCEKKEENHKIMWAYEKKLIEEVKKKFTEVDRELVTLNESIQKAIEMNKCEAELKDMKSRYIENDSRLQLIENDSNVLKTSNQTQMETIRSIQNDDQKRISQYTDSILLPIKIAETLAGLKIVDKVDIDQLVNSASSSSLDSTAATVNDPSADRISNRFDIMFLDLPDDFLNFDDNKQGLPPNSQVKLSVGLLEKYRAIHRKRKQSMGTQQSGRSLLNGLVVSNLGDFKTIYENFQTILGSYLTKQEIEKAGKCFGVDWIEGSPVISIILDSKATKMATLVLTKYYPMCGTSMIKLTSMTGYENSVVKSFRIEKIWDLSSNGSKSSLNSIEQIN